MKIGSLCTGYGGLDLAAETFFNAETIWCAENDKYASQVIEQRFGITNFGDIKTINWNELPQIDILTAGYPCQPFSTAGSRKGTDDPRHIWPNIKEAISILRPRLVLLENVRGHLSLGFEEVLKGFAEIGYDARWQIVRASDAGAPHQRARLFILAYPSGEGLQRTWDKTNNITNGIIADSNSDAHTQPRRTDRSVHGASSEIINRANWQERWRSFEITEAELPPTLEQGRLNAKFVEYMMGLPNGWVTDAGLSRTQQLKMLGNGVVPQQALLAFKLLTACG